jgi:hypothetical protein
MDQFAVFYQGKKNREFLDRLNYYQLLKKDPPLSSRFSIISSVSVLTLRATGSTTVNFCCVIGTAPWGQFGPFTASGAKPNLDVPM